LQTIKSETQKIKPPPPKKIAEKPNKNKTENSPETDIYGNAHVELYVTSWCKYCKKAEAFFRSKGVSFTIYDIEKDRVAAKRKNKLSPRKGVPFAIVNGQHIYGFAPSAYENALKTR